MVDLLYVLYHNLCDVHKSQYTIIQKIQIQNLMAYTYVRDNVHIAWTQDDGVDRSYTGPKSVVSLKSQCC